LRIPIGTGHFLPSRDMFVMCVEYGSQRGFARVEEEGAGYLVAMFVESKVRLSILGLSRFGFVGLRISRDLGANVRIKCQDLDRCSCDCAISITCCVC